MTTDADVNRRVVPDMLDNLAQMLAQRDGAGGEIVPGYAAALEAHLARHATDAEIEQINAAIRALLTLLYNVEFDTIPEQRAQTRGLAHCAACEAQPAGTCIVCGAVTPGWTCSRSCADLLDKKVELRVHAGAWDGASR